MSQTAVRHASPSKMPVAPEVTPQRLMDLAWNFAPPLMIEAAVTTGLFDALDHGPQTVDEVSRQTGSSPRGMRMLMNGLVSLDLLSKDSDDERYALTPESATFLVSGKQAFHGGFFRHLSGELLPRWMQLTKAVRTGQPAVAANQEKAGAEFFLNFVEDLFPINYRAAKALGGALHLSEAATSVPVLDLAAGSGVWGVGLAQCSHYVTVTAVDWPEVLPATRRVAERFGLAGRFHFIGGDLLAEETQFGHGHQIATLGHILHSEGADRSRELLKKTFAALAPGGTIAIAEFLPNDDRTGPLNAMIFAVNMLVHTERGDTFTVEEIREWLTDAGFDHVRTLEVPAPSPLVLATKPR